MYKYVQACIVIHSRVGILPHWVAYMVMVVNIENNIATVLVLAGLHVHAWEATGLTRSIHF